MSAPQYCGVDELMDRLGIAAGDPRTTALDQACGASSRWVEEQTGRRFYTLAETRYFSPHPPNPDLGYGGFPSTWGWAQRPFSGYAQQHIAIDDCLAVTSVATDQDGDGSYETLWTPGSDYWVGPRNAPARGEPFRTLNRNLAVGRYAFPLLEDSIAVTATFGTTAQTPPAIRELALFVAELYARDVMEMSIPGVSTYQLPSLLQVTMAPTDLPMIYQKTIEYWRHQTYFV